MERINIPVSALGWIGLAIFLFFSIFGLTGGICLLLCFISFITGFILKLYYIGNKKAIEWIRENNNVIFPPSSIGLSPIVDEVRKGRKKFKNDHRMTGSNVIDDVLHEIIDYIYRDYIYSWYKKISDDDEEFKHNIRHTMQQVIIAFSARSKQVDLIPYFTTRLVEDFASHIRLYRNALEKIKENEKDDTKPPSDLESIFFDLETEMEKEMCRDMVCTNEECETQFLKDLNEVLSYLLLPPEDFHNKPFRYILREILVNGIFLPTINMVADPDYINQTISWMCKDSHFTSEYLVIALKASDNIDELNAIKDMINLEVAKQRSKDSGGQNDTSIKQQLRSLDFLRKISESRIQQLEDGIDTNETFLPLGWDNSQKLYSLPFDVVLNNNVALSCFIEFMTNIGAQGYLFFYLTIEGYKVSAEQQISAALLADGETHKPDLEMLQEAAKCIYTQYLSEEASPKLKLDETVVNNMHKAIERQEPSETLFDEVQAQVWHLLQAEKYFPAFKKSRLYIKLLLELDLLQNMTKPDDTDSLNSEDGDNISISSKSSSINEAKFLHSKWSGDDLASSNDSLSSNENCSHVGNIKSVNEFTLNAHISNAGFCNEYGKSYAVYMISVTRINQDGTELSWDVYRRYSDFVDLHTTVRESYDSVAGLALPSKKAFNNMTTEFVEKRRIALNAYLKTLLNPSMTNSNKGLLQLLYQFLEHFVREKEKSQFSWKKFNPADIEAGLIDNLVNPFKHSVRNMGQKMKNMPNNFLDGVTSMSGGIKSIPTNMLDGVGKMLNVKGLRKKPALHFCNNLLTDWLPSLTTGNGASNINQDLLQSSKVRVNTNVEDDIDNIPLHIMLLLMDEIFDLKDRNHFFKRKIVALLRQIAQTVLGGSMNRKIVDFVGYLTSADQVAEYIKTFRDSYWPNGILAEPKPPRESDTKLRTRVVAKSKMLSLISDEIKHLIGSETTKCGVIRVFNMFQHPCLNKRLIYVILEGMLETLFPENKFAEVFRKIHSRSLRVKRKGGLTIGDVKITQNRK